MLRSPSPIVAVDSPDDRRLDDYRNLRDAVLLRERGLFIAEGRLVVRRLLHDSPYPTRSLMVTQSGLDAIADVLSPSGDAPVYLVPQAVMNDVAGFDIHRGCLAIGERLSPRPPLDIVSHARRIVLIERVGNADNIGGIFRSAAAFGFQGVLLDPSATDPLYRKAIRTSMAAALTVPFARTGSWPESLADVRAAGLLLIALTTSPEAPLLADVACDLRDERVGVVVGHEGDGLTRDTMAACDRRARITMAPGVDSLNVATAAAIAMYELRTSSDIGGSRCAPRQP